MYELGAECGIDDMLVQAKILFWYKATHLFDSGMETYRNVQRYYNLDSLCSDSTDFVYKHHLSKNLTNIDDTRTQMLYDLLAAIHEAAP